MKKVLVIGIIVALVSGSIYFFRTGRIADGVLGLLGLIVTFLLQYPAYKSAKEARIPIVTLEVIPKERSIYRFYEVKIHNNCPLSVKAKFDCSVTMWGRPLPIKTEFSESPVVINPHQNKTVWQFDVGRIVVDHYPYSDMLLEGDEKANPDHAILRHSIEAKLKPEQADKILRFKMSVDYIGLSSNEKGRPISEERFYDFVDRKISTPSIVNG